MRKFLVVHRRNLPTTLPVMGTLLFILAFDYWNAPIWLWVIGSFVVLCRWLVVFYRISKEKPFDLFPESVRDIEEPEKDLKATFRKIIKDASI